MLSFSFLLINAQKVMMIGLFPLFSTQILCLYYSYRKHLFQYKKFYLENTVFVAMVYYDILFSSASYRSYLKLAPSILRNPGDSISIT